ncbi:LytR/AlgR family response regulator transcription factor [Sphingobacterium sp. Mn56C]|uniref:LytR/AlgR family response regulator transcription factor n=1 Tax=Sphingobacterium sp. Mn56C TaxID=3395261 RepID=UPI003BEBBE14
MKVLIIEDEPLVAEDLIATLSRVMPDCEVLKHLQSVEESVNYLQENKVDIDLIFSDIQLGDGISFQIFNTVPIETPIVFCTAYDNYVLDAFKTNGIDYLLKPISEAAVQATLQKYYTLQKQLGRKQASPTPAGTDYDTLLTAMQPKLASILVHQQDRIIPLATDEIALCYIELENVFIKTFKGKDFMLQKSLDELEKSLGNNFYRANRQHLLARKALKHASYTLSRKLLLDIHVDYKPKVYVSREKATHFLRWLAG